MFEGGVELGTLEKGARTSGGRQVFGTHGLSVLLASPR